MGVVGLLVRAGVVVGAVYYSRKLGVWGTPEETDKLYNELKDEIRPHAKALQKKLPFDVPALPKSGEVRFLVKHYYNEGVKGTFHFIYMLPCYTGQLAKKAKEAFDEFSKAPPAEATNIANKK